MSMRKQALQWLQGGFAVASDGHIDVYALAARVHAQPPVLAEVLRAHFDVRVGGDGRLIWLPAADAREQGLINRCSARLRPLLPALEARPRSLSLVAAALDPTVAERRDVLAATLLRAGLAPVSPAPDSPWAAVRPRFAPPEAVAAAAADADARVLPPEDRFYAHVAAHALAAGLPTDRAAIAHLAWALFPTPLAPTLLPPGTLVAAARFEARTIPADVAGDVVLSARDAWISFLSISRGLAVDLDWVAATVPLHVETRAPKPGRAPSMARRFAFLGWARRHRALVREAAHRRAAHRAAQ